MKLFLRCDYCAQYYEPQETDKMLAHELKCPNNPKCKTCLTCANVKEIATGEYTEYITDKCSLDNDIDCDDIAYDMKPCANWIISARAAKRFS